MHGPVLEEGLIISLIYSTAVNDTAAAGTTQSEQIEANSDNVVFQWFLCYTP